MLLSIYRVCADYQNFNIKMQGLFISARIDIPHFSYEENSRDVEN